MSITSLREILSEVAYNPEIVNKPVIGKEQVPVKQWLAENSPE